MIDLGSTELKAIKCIVKNVDDIYELFSAYKLVFSIKPELANFDNFTNAVNGRLETISDKVFTLLGRRSLESYEERIVFSNGEEKC